MSDASTAEATYGHISGWDTSLITDMSYLFCANSYVVSVGYTDRYAEGGEDFNEDICGWDTSSVTTMRMMFLEAASFNQDVSGWDIANVVDAREMFAFASSSSLRLAWETRRWASSVTAGLGRWREGLADDELHAFVEEYVDAVGHYTLVLPAGALSAERAARKSGTAVSKFFGPLSLTS